MPYEETHRAAVAQALKLINAQDAFRVLGAPEAAEDGGTSIQIGVRPDLLFQWEAAGRSPNGVLVEELVTMVFPASFPLKAPKVYLREGFDCSHAHISPTGPGQRGVPCLIYGNLDEFHQREGMAVILNQLKLWLENAALGTLIDPNLGWEPTWRDYLPDLLVANSAYLRQKVEEEPKGGTAWFRLDYLEFEENQRGKPSRQIHAQLRKEQIRLNERTISGLLEKRLHRENPKVAVGHSLGLIVWPRASIGHQPVVAEGYSPETVQDLAGLLARAREFGCEEKLNEALSWLEQLLRRTTYGGPWPLVVILCARRPFNLIGCDSALELCPYVLDIQVPMALPIVGETMVRPVGHRHEVSVDLLQQMSGLMHLEVPRDWVQIGCGSLGSKIALHLARAGWAPKIVVDSGVLTPHNAARHALIRPASIGDVLWAGAKSEALAEAINGLDARPTSYVHDATAGIHDAEIRAHILPQGKWMVVNSTASLCVRESLGAIPYENGAPRVVETSLYSDGQIGVLTVEGPARNPNTLDLLAHLYDLARTTPGLQERFFARGPKTGRQSVGEGCGSETMVMSDARVSMFAAPMAEALMAQRERDLPSDGGRILIGSLGEDGLSLGWQSHSVAPPVVVVSEGGSGWDARISAQANQCIREEVSRCPEVETGGILVGRHSEVARTFYVTGVLPAPPDSTRSAAEFVLGVQGLEEDLAKFSQDCGEGLYFLGTWHSHLLASGPSRMDQRTARLLGETRLVPSLMLIHTPSGYRVLPANSVGP